VNGSNRYEITYRGRPVLLQILNDQELVLSLDGVVRKRRNRTGVTCVYVWTNVELHWEEHHFIEARWWPQSGLVRVTANGAVLLEDARAVVE
jgi:hypothetical protein